MLAPTAMMSKRESATKPVERDVTSDAALCSDEPTDVLRLVQVLRACVARAEPDTD